ncbi:MAG TPA: alpha/beta fold hydrolase [Candidatus Eisenbacteria bacterium]|nr:alpha/beta fold hydrolase [Candidatus Eisenbacteria bacterium]
MPAPAVAFAVFAVFAAFAALAAPAAGPARAAGPAPAEGDFVIRDFHFHDGSTLPGLRLHYLTLGRPRRDARGDVANAVLILHGTSGSGRQFLAPQFAGVLYGPGAPFDTTRTYVILPDGIGHGRSSKPSDGLHARFPHYDYDDMVAAQHALLTDHLGVRHLRLVMGTSMGGMQTWVWGETYPEFMDALMPLACLPVAIVGRNRLWRDMVTDAIRNDPAWLGGEYAAEPRAGLRTALDMLILAGSAPLVMQAQLATRDSVDRFLANAMATRLPQYDANDLLYQVEASRNYDPSPQLERIQAPVMFVNSADDFINPPELGIAEREIGRVKRGRYVLIPTGPQTHGHGTHTWAAVWKPYLEELLRGSAPADAGVSGR